MSPQRPCCPRSARLADPPAHLRRARGARRQRPRPQAGAGHLVDGQALRRRLAGRRPAAGGRGARGRVHRGRRRPLRPRTCTRASLVVVGAVFVVVKRRPRARPPRRRSSPPSPGRAPCWPTRPTSWRCPRWPWRGSRRGRRGRHLVTTIAVTCGGCSVLPLVVLADDRHQRDAARRARGIALVDGRRRRRRLTREHVVRHGGRLTLDSGLPVRGRGRGARPRVFQRPPVAPSRRRAHRRRSDGVLPGGRHWGRRRPQRRRRTYLGDGLDDPRRAPRRARGALRARGRTARTPTASPSCRRPTGSGSSPRTAATGSPSADEHGTWTRIGFTYAADGPPVVPLPGEPTTMAYPVPFAVMLAVPAASVTLVAERVVDAGPDPGRPGRAAGCCSPWPQSLSVVGVRVDDASAVVSGQEIGSTADPREPAGACRGRLPAPRLGGAPRRRRDHPARRARRLAGGRHRRRGRPRRRARRADDARSRHRGRPPRRRRRRYRAARR